MWAERCAPSAPTWLLILALHAGVLALLNTRPTRIDTPREWSQLRLIPTRDAEAPRPTPANVQRAHAPEAGPPAAMALPTPADEPATTTMDGAPPSTASEAPPPLRLSLPDRADTMTRQPALDDPRGNTPVSRFGARLAHDLGDDGRWLEERMDADTVRLRRGNTCINLHRARGATLQPFNESAAPTPWGATPAYRCERR